MGVVPPAPDFLETLRGITERDGALLIFDEVITGFRLAYGGAQDRFQNPAGHHRPRQDHRRGTAGRGLRRPPRDHGHDRAARPRLSGGDALRKSARDARRPRHPAEARSSRLLRRARRKGRSPRPMASAPPSTNRACPAKSTPPARLLTLFFTVAPGRATTLAQRNRTRRGSPLSSARCSPQGILLPPSQFEALFVSAAHTDADIDRTIAAARASLNARLRCEVAARPQRSPATEKADTLVPYRLARRSPATSLSHLIPNLRQY